MNNLYRVDSNRESGHGRCDIQLRPYDKKMPGIIIELKVLKDGIAEALTLSLRPLPKSLWRKSKDGSMSQR